MEYLKIHTTCKNEDILYFYCTIYYSCTTSKAKHRVLFYQFDIRMYVCRILFLFFPAFVLTVFSIWEYKKKIEQAHKMKCELF